MFFVFSAYFFLVSVKKNTPSSNTETTNNRSFGIVVCTTLIATYSHLSNLFVLVL